MSQEEKREIWRIRKYVQHLIPFTNNSRCEHCSRKRRLNRHHADGNIRNNVRENIVVLCLRCHIKVHLAMGTWSTELEYMAAD